MFLFRVRRLPHLLFVAGMSPLVGRRQRAPAPTTSSCSISVRWAGRRRPVCSSWSASGSSGTPSGVITSPVVPSDEAKSAFRSLMSELGVVAAPRLMTPADTLGFAGFQFSAELGVTRINPERTAGTLRYWDGTSGVSAIARDAMRPSSYITTVGGYVRKGLWLPLPAFEFGAGVMSILGSKMYTSRATQNSRYRKAFTAGRCLRSRFADRRRSCSAPIRSTWSSTASTSWPPRPSASAERPVSNRTSAGTCCSSTRAAASSTPPRAATRSSRRTRRRAAAPAGIGCAAAQNGNSWNDLNANFTFPAQDVITRQRWFGGFKLKLAVLFLAAQVDVALSGSSRDGSPEGNADRSGRQETYSLSAGLGNSGP